jgi:CDGSH-type Zn-finger protein
MSDIPVKITISPNGSAKIEAERVEIHMPDGTVVIKEGKFSLCRCGASATKPFCDGTHKTNGFVG